MMSESSQYIDRKAVDQSYRPKSGMMSPGLKRAREPYRIKNALTGIALGAFAVGVWAYSINAVKQDVFDDIDEEVRAMAKTGATIDALPTQKGAPVTGQPTPLIPAASVPSSPTLTSLNVSQHRGLLRHLDGRFPSLLDPQRKTLVWGAPPVDNIGKIGKP